MSSRPPQFAYHTITPVLFAAAVETALGFMQDGGSISASALRACRLQHIDEAWSIPLIGLLDNSPTTAEAWARVQFAAALELTSERLG